MSPMILPPKIQQPLKTLTQTIKSLIQSQPPTPPKKLHQMKTMMHNIQKKIANGVVRGGGGQEVYYECGRGPGSVYVKINKVTDGLK